jgi:hypothetical protein
MKTQTSHTASPPLTTARSMTCHLHRSRRVAPANSNHDLAPPHESPCVAPATWPAVSYPTGRQQQLLLASNTLPQGTVELALARRTWLPRSTPPAMSALGFRVCCHTACSYPWSDGRGFARQYSSMAERLEERRSGGAATRASPEPSPSNRRGSIHA